MKNDVTIPDISNYSWATGAPEKEEPLKLYFVLFSVHKRKEWSAHAGYIFGYDEDSLTGLLEKKYGDVIIRSVKEVDIKEGTVLYGERWTAL